MASVIATGSRNFLSDSRASCPWVVMDFPVFWATGKKHRSANNRHNAGGSGDAIHDAPVLQVVGQTSFVNQTPSRLVR